MVKIRRHMAPLTRTSGRGNKQKYITIHETANRGRGANANSHARLQAGTNSRQASWHYQVDDKEIVQSFDDNVRCWHAGAKANNESIAIEICVNSDGNYQKALDNAAALVAHLRKKHNIPWNRVVSHKFWTGKNCPTIMLSRKGQWDKFIKATEPGKASNVSTSSKPKPAPKPKPKPASSSGGSKYPHVALPLTDSHTTASHNAWVYLMRHAVNRTDRNLTINIQRWLRDLNYYKGAVDGSFGPVTVRALQSFLVSKGLLPNAAYVDGNRGPKTIRAEIQYLNDQRQYLI